MRSRWKERTLEGKKCKNRPSKKITETEQCAMHYKCNSITLKGSRCKNRPSKHITDTKICTLHNKMSLPERKVQHARSMDTDEDSDVPDPDPGFIWNKFNAKYCFNSTDFIGDDWSWTEDDSELDEEEKVDLKKRDENAIIIYTTPSQRYYCYDRRNVIRLLITKGKQDKSNNVTFKKGTTITFAPSYTLDASHLYTLMTKSKPVKVYGIVPGNYNSKVDKLIELFDKGRYDEWVRRMEIRQLRQKKEVEKRDLARRRKKLKEEEEEKKLKEEKPKVRRQKRGG